MSGETTTFAASGEDAITRTIDVQLDATVNQLSPSEFDNFYEIERTAAEIAGGDYKRVMRVSSPFAIVLSMFIRF